jgi:transposase
MEPKCVADVEGPWRDPQFESGLIAQCRRYWSIPVELLPNQALATYLRQKLGLAVVMPEAQRRVESGVDDDSELYDGELAEALKACADGN